MATRLKNLNADQRKLILSLAANFATRIPGLAGVLFFMPRLKHEIGLQSFATLMAAIALGGNVPFVMSGVTFVARRLFGEAFSRGDREAEADAARAVFDVSLIGTSVLCIVIVAFAAARGSTGPFYVAALLTLVAVLFQQQDGVRAAYNEHYITAALLFLAQTLAYIIALLFIPRSAYGIVLGASVMVGPLILSSFISLIMLVYKRPYLCFGHPRLRAKITKEALLLGFGEGLLMASLGFVTLYLDFIGKNSDSAWYATTLRLFMIILVPVVLILLPLSSYIRLIWGRCSILKQRNILVGTLVVSMVYSLAVGVLMVILSRMYVGKIMKISEPGTLTETISIFCMFSSVVVFKSYTSVSFVVIDNRWLPWATTLATLSAICLAAVSTLWLSPIGAVSIFAAGLTSAIFGVTTLDAWRFYKKASKVLL